MPSFFESLSRLIKGKPVFTEEDQKWDDEPKPAPEAPAPASATTPDVAAGPKIVPVVFVESIECRTNGANMDCDAVIHNNSQVRIELDKIRLLGTSRELDNFLNPGGEREFRIYSGPRPQNTYSTTAELLYKDPSGDYFSATHQIEFEKESDSTYTIRRMRFIPPVRDV